MLQTLFDREEIKSERYTNYIRIFIAFFYLSAAFTIKHEISVDAFNVILAVALVSLLYGIMVLYVFARYRPVGWLKYPSVMIDIILLSVVLHVLGSNGVFKTEAFLLYYLWIGLAILRFSPRMTLLTGILGFCLYSAISFDLVTDVALSSGSQGTDMLVKLQPEVALRLFFLILFVAIATYASSVYRLIASKAIREGQLLEKNLKLTETQEKLRDTQKQLAARNRELATLSEIDALTQHYNKRKIEQILAESVRRNPPPTTQTAIILININRLRTINERFGRAAGDRIIRGIADLLRLAARGGDCIGRWDGCEFIIVCQDTDQEKAHAICERLRRRIASQRFGVDYNVTCSFGLALLRPGDNLHSLLKRAQTDLYHTKFRGNDQITAA